MSHDLDDFAKRGNDEMVWKKGEPNEYERTFRNLSGRPGINQNWLEDEAVKAGVDYDHIRGFDDEFGGPTLENNCE